jgi:Na+-translocating ferredoxin:NAD+ oxidoreductase subunit B
MSETIFRRLQQKLDQYSMGFPATESGIELTILKRLFSKEDAGLFLSLSHELAPAEKIAADLGQPLESIAAQLEEMAHKGLLFRLKKPDRSLYASIPFVHGLFEFQVKNLDREFAELVSRYFDEAFDDAMLAGADFFLRTVPVNESIELSQAIAAFDDAVEILKSKSKIVVTDCICRKRTEVLEESCGKPLEACFMFGSMGQYYLDRNIGRAVSQQEAIKILKECQAAGLVTQPATSQNPGGICNCCGDCCGVLKALKKHPKPAEAVFSNYVALSVSDECTGCEDCLDRCEMEAIHMTEQETALVITDRCIGCGLCVTTCPSGAMRLQPKPGDYRLPPSNTAEQMMLMAQKRGLV